MEKQKTTQTAKLIISAFIFLLLGYGFSHYLTFVNWLCNKSYGSGSAYYVYYVNGIRTSGGGTLAMFIFIILGIIVPALLFSLIFSKLDKLMKARRNLPNGIENRNEYLRLEREMSERSYYIAAFVLTIIFAAVAIAVRCYAVYKLRVLNPNALTSFSPEQSEYLVLYIGHISRGAVIICSLYALWGANAFGKPKILRTLGIVAVVVALCVNIFFDYYAIRGVFIGAPGSFRFIWEGLLYLVMVVLILILRKRGRTRYELTLFLSLGIIVLSILINHRFHVKFFDVLLSSQVIPLIFLAAALDMFGNRLNRIGRLFQ